ncbi:MAG TPA: hypothetical protein VLE69_02310 [Candidatus Saccharimonadales bacterium]|nr:hypothetical protein [Candidatus Saccharimonadales bacterium]
MTEVLMPSAGEDLSDFFAPELFENETLFNREQIIDFCFTPHETSSGRKIVDVKLYENGIGTFAKLAPTSSFIMPQIRDKYDANHIMRLGRNICDPEAGQLQNCGAALISANHIEQYVEDLNTFFGTTIEVDDIPYHEKFGGYLVTAFGHSRQLGVGAVNRDNNGDSDTGTPLFFMVFNDPPFWKVLEMQAVENTGLLPNMWERSRAIVHYKAMRTRDGVTPTQQEIAEKFGVDSDQVWRAERYEALPGEIKELVMEDKLPYSGSFELDRLFDFYSEEDVIQLAQRLADRKASTGQVVEEVKKRVIVAHLTPEVFVLVEAGSITLPQAQELNRMKGVAIGSDTINEMAEWISTKKPDIKEIRKSVSAKIELQLSGIRAIWDEADGLDPEDRETMLRQLREEDRTVQIRTSTHEALGRISGIRALFNSGIITPEYAQKGVAKDAIGQDFNELLERVANGDVEDIDPRLLEEIEGILDIEEQLATGEITETPLQIAARTILARIQAEHSEQASLFTA